MTDNPTTPEIRAAAELLRRAPEAASIHADLWELLEDISEEAAQRRADAALAGAFRIRLHNVGMESPLCHLSDANISGLIRNVVQDTGARIAVGDEPPTQGPDLDALAERFLKWPLPESVCSDLCVTWAPEVSRVHHPRQGTNLLTYLEAKQMLAHVLEITEEPTA